jgi:hypothetical protein
MPKPIDVLLHECDAAGGPLHLRAVLDELTLTYTLVERGPDGRTRELRRHVPSLREARRWAALNAGQRECAPEPRVDQAA